MYQQLDGYIVAYLQVLKENYSFNECDQICKELMCKRFAFGTKSITAKRE